MKCFIVKLGGDWKLVLYHCSFDLLNFVSLGSDKNTHFASVISSCWGKREEQRDKNTAIQNALLVKVFVRSGVQMRTISTMLE